MRPWRSRLCHAFLPVNKHYTGLLNTVLNSVLILIIITQFLPIKSALDTSADFLLSIDLKCFALNT